MMKSAAIFCVLATFCFFGNGDAANNAGTAAISRLKQTTTSTKNDLDRYGRNFVFTLSSKLSDQKITQLSKINSIVNPVITDIQAAIAAAKESGKNADHCFEPARLILRQASIDAGKELDQCKDAGLATVQPVKSNIDATVLLGSSIVNELDGIAIKCLSANPLEYQHCIILQIPNASATVKTYQNTASELKRTGDSLSSSALTTAFSCNQAPTQKVRQAASDVRVSSNSCISNA